MLSIINADRKSVRCQSYRQADTALRKRLRTLAVKRRASSGLVLRACAWRRLLGGVGIWSAKSRQTIDLAA